MRLSMLVAALLCGSSASMAQTATAPVLPAEEQISQAVLPLPNDLRESASVLGYAPDGKFVPLRSGTGGMVCLASNPSAPRFHVACYHKSLEPFMARGRELRTQGVQGTQVDSVRFREAREGKLKLPTEPAVLYSLTGPNGKMDVYDRATKTVTGTTPLFVVYMPNSTPESTGLSAIPARGTPWIMNAGTPKAHIMFVPSMQP